MQIPVIILSGFLGSGKTTLLLELLQEADGLGLKPGVLINELGKQDVDGQIVGERAGVSLRLLMDGCVCCSRKGELDGCLRELLDRSPDLLLIELTGVANPEEIADAIRNPALADRLQPPRIVTLLDAEHALEYNSVFASDRELVRTLRRQVESADWIVVNKTDLVRPDRLDKIDKMARKHNARARLFRAVRCRIDAAELMAGLAPPSARREEPRRGTVTSGAASHSAPGSRIVGESAGLPIRTNSGAAPHFAPGSPTIGENAELPIRTVNGAAPHSAPGSRIIGESAGVRIRSEDGRQDGPADENRLGAVPAAQSFALLQTFTLSCSSADRIGRHRLERLLAAWSPQLVRAKGYIRTEDGDGVMLVQHAGGRTSWEASSYPGTPYLVVIGSRLDERGMRAQWAALGRTEN